MFFVVATLGYVLSPDGREVLMIRREGRPDDLHLGKYNGLGGKLEPDEDVCTGIRREIREETGLPVSIADDPLCSVVLGTGKMLSDFKLLRKISIE